MTTKHQKNLEIMYSEEAGKLLGEKWCVKPSPDEVNWPDVLVETETGAFGLEVREIYTDEPIRNSVRKKGVYREGSKSKREESRVRSKIKKLAVDYYKETEHYPLRVNFLGNLDRHDDILRAMLDEGNNLCVMEQKRIEPYDGCIMYIRRLPDLDHFQEYDMWQNVSDMVGSPKRTPADVINYAIEDKAKKLPRYTENIQDVRLLLVSDMRYNSGKARPMDDIDISCHGFSYIYYCSYPQKVWKWQGC